MVLEQPDRFTEHRPAHAVAIDERTLGAQEIPDGQFLHDDVADDGAGNIFGPFVRRRASEADCVGKDLLRPATTAQVVGFGFEVLAHPVSGQSPVPRRDRGHDACVGVP